MSVIRNLAAAAGAAALALSMLSGNASAQESVLDKVKQTGTLKVCFAQGQPDNYKDPKTGEWTGVFVDLVHQLADWMKVEIEPVEVQWNVAVLSLNRGTATCSARAWSTTRPVPCRSTTSGRCGRRG